MRERRVLGPMLRRKVMVLLYRHAPDLQVLLLKRVKTEKGEWHPVTGNVEPHEPIPIAAVREVAEETGFDVRPEPLGLTHTYAAKGRRFHETMFVASVPQDEAVVLSEEHTESAWLGPDEARSRLNFAEQKRALDALVARIRK